MRAILLAAVLVLGCSAEDDTGRTPAPLEQQDRCVCENGTCHFEKSGGECCICPSDYECLKDMSGRFYCGHSNQ